MITELTGITEPQKTIMKDDVQQLKTGYFQKSTFLLYPVLNIKTSPLDTFIRGHGISEKDQILMVRYNEKMPDFDILHERVLLHHKYLHHVVTDPSIMVYMFNMGFLGDDWNHFLKGRYSKMYETVKEYTRSYYERKSDDFFYSESYLDPNRFIPYYSNLLWDYKDQSIGIDILEKLGELCDKPDLEKETLLLTDFPHLKFPKRKTTFAK